MPAPIDRTGHKYGRWTILERLTRRRFLCRCECGTEEAIHLQSDTNSGAWGCKACQSKRRRVVSKVTHGLTKKGQLPAEYACWRGMRVRCQNPKATGYHNYGGRGISVCPQWEDFAVFMRDVGRRPSPQHTLERIDNDGNYEPGNVRWATKKEQGRNSRFNRLITHDGLTMPMVSWAEKVGLPKHVLYIRLNRLGHSVDRALTQPLETRHRVTSNTDSMRDAMRSFQFDA